MKLKSIEVHNVWTLYALNPDGSRARQPFAAAGQRPQDWGDKDRWTYHRFRFEWLTAPDDASESPQGGDQAHWINNFHGWTDLKLEPGKYPGLFAPLITRILWPGAAWQTCGQQFLHEDDFWREAWGPMPPLYEGPELDRNEPLPGFEPEPEEEAEAIQMMARVFKEPTEVIIQAQSFDLFQLVGLIQFATRGLPPHHRLHLFARKIGDQIAEAVILAAGEPDLRRFIEMGWNPTYDIIQKDETGPGGEE